MITRRILPLLALFTLSGSAIAADSGDHGLYLSAEGGYSRFFNPNHPMNTSGSHKVNSFEAWGANLGYAFPLDSIAAVMLELDYDHNGRNQYTGSGGAGDQGTLNINSSDVALLGAFNSVWDNGFNMFVKAGPAYVKQKANLTSSAYINGTQISAFNNDHYSIQGKFVAGVGYKLTQMLNSYLSVSYTSGSSRHAWSQTSNPGPSTINQTVGVFAVKVGLSLGF